MAAINLPFAASATKRAPNAGELANGFPCGDADKELFDWLAWWKSGQIARAIAAGGLTIDDTDLDRLARAIQQGMNAATATGTANAWVVPLSLAPLAYAFGLSLDIIAPATNTSTTVNANVAGLGDRRIKKSDGTDPVPGDLVAGKVYQTIDDGTNVRVLNFLPSDLAAQKSPFNLAQATSSTRTTYTGVTGYQTVLSGTYTKKTATSVVDIRTVLNVLSNAAIAAGLFRIVFGGVQGDKHIAVNMTSTSNQTSPHGDDTFAGTAAGAVAWSLQIGRDDANAWTSVWNPDSTNTSNLPAFTTTVVKFQEREP